MIILLHGTGDDSSKWENWIRWVEKLMSARGEDVLTVAGVGSKGKTVVVGEEEDVDDDEIVDHGQDSIGNTALEFIERISGGPRPTPSTLDRLTGYSGNERTALDTRRALPALLAALNDAGGDQFPRAAKVPKGGEEGLIRDLVANKKKDGPALGTGIKYRAAVASVCAVAYVRRSNQLPVRIIGHSRGGSTAVAIHNILTYHGVYCTTLTLDPCHGKKKFFPKEYYRKIWSGQLINQPNKKNVGKDWLPDILMERPLIELGKGGDATVVNLPRTTHIKHGHMGKLRGFSDAEKSSGLPASLGMRIDSWCADSARIPGKQQVLLDFFKTFMLGPDPGVLADRKTIGRLVVEVLTGGITGNDPYWA